MRRLAQALLVCACVAACSPGSADKPPQKLERYVLEQAPADVGQKLDVSFDGKITLLGARVEAPKNLSNRGKVKVTFYWRSDAPVDEDVRLSTHLLDGAGKQIHELDYVGPLRRRDEQMQTLGPGRWKPGHVYVDEQVFMAPSVRMLKTHKFEIAVSLAEGEVRLPVVRGKADARNRVTVGEVAVMPRPAPVPAPATPSVSASAGSAAPAKSAAPTLDRPRVPSVTVPKPSAPQSEKKASSGTKP